MSRTDPVCRPLILRNDAIRRIAARLSPLERIEDGFASYTRGEVTVPPVGELLLEHGEVHLKYGYIHGDEFYVIKIASGFYGNPLQGLPSSNGLMLLFRQATGELVSILLDEGYLTDWRTALAGAAAAKHLAPSVITRIGIVGTGTQATLQLLELRSITACRDVLVWGRSAESAETYRDRLTAEGFHVGIAAEPSEILRTCNLVVTTTPAKAPLLRAGDLRKGTHITAVGSDTPEKQELETAILQSADLVVADSTAQCHLRGEIHHALREGVVMPERIVELGAIIAGTVRGRSSDQQISVADLTGVAVQDIVIAEAVYRHALQQGTSA